MTLYTGVLEGWEVVKVYEENDTGISTRSRKPRPLCEAMPAAASAGEIDAILGYSNCSFFTIFKLAYRLSPDCASTNRQGDRSDQS